MPTSFMPNESGFSNPWTSWDFGVGGMWNGFSQANVPYSGAAAQPSGGFNLPGMTGNTNDFGIPSVTGGSSTNSGNPFTAFGTDFLTGSQLGNFGSSTATIPGSKSPLGLNAIGQPIIGGNQLNKIYGTDIGQAIQAFLNSGAGFNSNVIAAEMNAAMPIEARGRANLMNQFGNTGQAFGSAAAVGLGDFESSFSSALEGMFAQQYEQSVQNYLSVLMGVAPSAQQQNAQRGSFLSSLTNILPLIGPLIGTVKGLFNNNQNSMPGASSLGTVLSGGAVSGTSGSGGLDISTLLSLLGI